MSRHAVATDTGRRRIDLVPVRDDLVDAGFVLVLMGLALLGFRTTYSGSLYLVAGLAGVVLGVLIGHLANALRQPMIAVAAMTLAVFFLAGGAIALHSKAIAGVLPSGATVRGLSNQSVHGWKDLLTTLPPVDGSGPLVVLPYLLGLLGGVGAFCLARRTRPSWAPVAVPFAVLIAVILLGTQTPPARLLQGAVFGVVALGWAALRAARLRPTFHSGAGRGQRIATVGVLLALSGAGAAFFGPHLPGAGAERVVLRSQVTPPFDIGQYPSPLAGFRKYRKLPAQDLYGKTLFTVSGLPAGTLLRVATMDDYNGLTWTATNRADSGALPDTFQRVGTQIDNPIAGTTRSFRVTIGAYQDVWLPDAGAVTELAFTGKRAGSHGDHFRYNLATGTGVVPDGLAAGDSYHGTTRLPAVAELRKSDQVSTSGSAVDPALVQFTKASATSWGQARASATQKIFNIADYLHTNGKFSDGEHPNEQYLPGHYLDRLRHFLGDVQIVGDDEQYAAAFAAMINELGTPARVVLGAQLTGSGSDAVKGSDIHAWVEVQLVDGSWRAILTDRFMDQNKPPSKQPPVEQPPSKAKIVPPPARARQHSSLDDAADALSRTTNQTHHTSRHGSGGFSLPGWVTAVGRWAGPPVLLVALICALIVGMKARRRQLRRTRGRPATRLARGWHELVDHARDLGTAMPGGRTRREQAAVLATHNLVPLAELADAHVFGAADPGDQEARDYWAQVDAARKRMSSTVGRWRRIRAALNPASLRSPRGQVAGESP